MNFSIAVLFFASLITGFSSCTKHNNLIDANPAPPEPEPILQGDTLTSMKLTSQLGIDVNTTTGYIWDGTLDAAWGNAKKLTVHAVVPDAGNNTFDGFIGNSTDITLRSAHDNTNIWFLVEFPVPFKGDKSSYFHDFRWPRPQADHHPYERCFIRAGTERSIGVIVVFFLPFTLFPIFALL